MRMEYFNKIQCYRPSIGIVDAPVSIDEIALLQDSVDKNMFRYCICFHIVKFSF